MVRGVAGWRRVAVMWTRRATGVALGQMDGKHWFASEMPNVRTQGERPSGTGARR